MGLLSSFLSRKSAAPAGDAVEQARVRARRRLIGAAVLVGAGIVGFPILFETQPRPMAVDVPIEIPRKDAVAPLPAPAPRASGKVVAAAPKEEMLTERASDAGREVPAPSEPAAEKAAPKPVDKVAEAPAAKVEPKPAEKAAEKPLEKPAAKAEKPVDKPAEKAAAKAPEPPKRDDKTPADAARAKAALEGKAVASARMVVQVGAFADAGAARDARARVEKLGLKTYTQVVETDAGKRIRVRVGPFESRDEADRAAGRLKSAGLQAAVLTL